MKSKSIWMMGVMVIVIVAIAAVMVITVMGSKKTVVPASNSTATTKTTTYSPPKACEILPLATAQAVDAGVKASDTPASDVSTDSIAVSTCSYYDSATQVAVSLLVRGAKDGVGADSNQKQFTAPPASAQTVTGYGDKAYWDPTYGQLNILRHDNWYILSNGKVMPTERSLDEAKKLADILINKL